MTIFLSVATTVCLGLLAGTEFAVSAFVNPVLWQLEPRTQASLIRTFGKNLGAAMPVWYGLSFLLLLVECVLYRHAPGFWLLIAASAIWMVVIVLTLLFLVPLNNRLVALDPGDWTEETWRAHGKWDARHRLRIAALVTALVCFALAVHA
ncbi:MAG: DUF1772 domain-containing protein [Terracidiphilus sp.]